MRELPLRNRAGETIAHALVDDEDYSRVTSRGRWHRDKDGRPAHSFRIGGRKGLKRVEYLHRFILGLEPGDGQEVDHIDRNPLNNQKANLRLATTAQNHQNLSSYRGSRSTFRGVAWDKSRNKWMAYAALNGRHRTLGRFDNEKEAAQAAASFRAANMPFSSDATV